MANPKTLIRRATLASLAVAVLAPLHPATAGPVRVGDALPYGPASASASASASGARPVSAAEAAYRLGLERIAADDIAGAKAAFEGALKQDPGFAAAALGLGEVANRSGKLDEAGRWIRKAVALNPADPYAQASLGRYLAVKGDAAGAQAALRRAAELDARAVRPRIDLADLLASSPRPADAIVWYEQVIALQPDHAGAHFGLGVAAARAGDTDRARASLERAAAIEPGNPLPAVELGRLALAKRDWPQAMTQADRALAIQPKLVAALVLRGDIHDAQGRPEAALAAYADAARAAPASALPWMRTAMLQQRRGHLDEAAAAYRRAIEVDPAQPLAYNNLAALAVERKQDLAKAEQWARKAIELAPKAAEFQDTLGWVLRARGQLPAARAALNRAVELAPKAGQIRYHLAVVQAEAGDAAGARSNLKQALAGGDFASAEDARKLLAKLGA